MPPHLLSTNTAPRGLAHTKLRYCHRPLGSRSSLAVRVLSTLGRDPLFQASPPSLPRFGAQSERRGQPRLAALVSALYQWDTQACDLLDRETFTRTGRVSLEPRGVPQLAVAYLEESFLTAGMSQAYSFVVTQTRSAANHLSFCKYRRR
jgi:hypothetical protein